jgi:hypothetical protein
MESNDRIMAEMRSAMNDSFIFIRPKQTSHSCEIDIISNSTEQTFVEAEIRQLSLDILVYPELGMNKLTLLLARNRFAPIQAVFWGHPISQVDHFTLLSILIVVPENFDFTLHSRVQVS